MGQQAISPLQGAIIVISFAAGMSASMARADLSAPVRPTTVLDGFEAEPCAWPSAVFLQGEGNTCTGVYVGGRVILTAAHCLDDLYDTGDPCQVDSDCKLADEFGNPLDLICQDLGGGEGRCRNTESLIVNTVPAVMFGERYPNGAEHPSRTIPVQYCRQRGIGKKPAFDFGYCVLSEEPAVQPVPMMMHCEADLFLKEGATLVAIGFGTENLNDIPAPKGTKHFLRSTLAIDSSSVGDISPTPWVGDGDSPGLAEGDSGGPLFVLLPDGTWRLVGLAETAVSHQIVWRNVEWMLEDANVAAEQEKILPCHTPDGQWSPTASCGGFPLDPDLPQGDWTRGAFACHHPEVSGPSATCGEPFTPFAVASHPVDPPMKPATEQATPPVPRNRDISLLGPLLAGGLGAGVFVSRRRRNSNA